MAQKSKIEWTDASWNPIVGCSKVSKGCDHCYAIGQAHRLASNPATPQYHGLTQITNGRPNWSGKVALVESALELPLHWKKPKKIFVNSMSDLFHEAVPDEWIDRTFAVMALCPQHTFQILTKRPERMQKYFLAGKRESVLGKAWTILGNPKFKKYNHSNITQRIWPLPNVWMGVSVEDQKTADERIPPLLQTPAAVRWVSYEPALGPVDFSRWLKTPHADGASCGLLCTKLDWNVCGGESGSGARPMHPHWARSVRDQCVAAGVPFFFKQWGAWTAHDVVPGTVKEHSVGPERCVWMHPDGDVRKIGHGDKRSGDSLLIRVDKKAAGRLLDGREWNQFPTK